ncbi:hypothetical protein [Paenibacillus sp. URB8-2]|uniref:hypothetical protein n=1 Tax=Paenibacillus sp. URB8-2 TaxID=2741301 RepID=UPI0015BAC6C1|nr:hypothetical protein [Paenibacillus sp. URB8-2]BCG57457.1 hypothetical protein PUR_08820 [Paenibacillus sp. URB8-2]
MKVSCNSQTSADTTWRRLELKRLKWQINNGRAKCNPEVTPAALDWLDGEIAELEGR